MLHMQSTALIEKKHPFFRLGKAHFLLALRDGVTVGRISVHIHSLYNQIHQDKTGFFGFFECIDDARAARALFEAGEAWLKAQGCDKILGPICFTTNDGNLGILAENRNGPAMLLCPYNPPYYLDLLESAGYQKAKDLYGWHYEVGQVPKAPQRVAEIVEKTEGLVIRPLQLQTMSRDFEIIEQLFNASWSKNWGYVPWTRPEIEYTLQSMKLFMIPELTAIAEVHGEPAGLMLALPNILEAIKDLNGRLFPTGLIKLMYRLKLSQFKYETARVILLGVKPAFRGSTLGGLSVLLYVHAHRAGQKLGLKSGDLGPTLEDSQKINAGIQFMGGKIGKIYRVYGKDI